MYKKKQLIVLNNFILYIGLVITGFVGHYFLDFNTAAGYIEHQVPHMVNAESAYATGQLPDNQKRCR